VPSGEKIDADTPVKTDRVDIPSGLFNVGKLTGQTMHEKTVTGAEPCRESPVGAAQMNDQPASCAGGVEYLAG